eukprot:jgi/Mesvir1/5833/Mv00628-RA.1
MAAQESIYKIVAEGTRGNEQPRSHVEVDKIAKKSSTTRVPSHRDSSQIQNLMNPVKGVRDDMERRGITPKDHAKENKQKLAETSARNQLKKLELALEEEASMNPNKAKPAPRSSVERAPSREPAGDGEGRRDYVAMNKSAAVEPKARPAPASNPKEALLANQKDFGKVPKYLQERKQEMQAEAERRRAEDAEEKCPPGMRLLPEEERLQTLATLEENKRRVDQEIQSLPFVIETPSQKRRQADLERRLLEIEQARKLFSRKKAGMHAKAAGRKVRLAAEGHDERIQSALAQLVPGPDLPPHHAIRIASLPAPGWVAASWAESCRLLPLLATAAPDLLDPSSPLPFVTAIQEAYAEIQQACSPVRAAQAVQRHLPRGTPSVASVQSPAAFPARVIDKHQTETYAGILHTADWIALFADLNAQGPTTRWPLRHQLFAPQPLVPAGRPCGSCGQPLDPTGTHYLACMGGQQNQNWYLYLHTVLLTVVLAMIRSVFPHANIRSEDADGAAFYSPNHRPDIVVLDFEGGGRHLLIDVSVARPLALSHVAGASLTAGYTADRAERAKLLAYGDVGHHRVVPFVLEEFGAMGPLTSAFFKECCRLREDRLDLEGQRAPWSARTWTSYWRQRLSVALTRAMADIMLRRTRADFAVQQGY